MTQKWQAPPWLDVIWDEVKQAHAEAPDGWWGEALGFGTPPAKHVAIYDWTVEWLELLGTEAGTLLRAHLILWWWMQTKDRSHTPTAHEVFREAKKKLRIFDPENPDVAECPDPENPAVVECQIGHLYHESEGECPYCAEPPHDDLPLDPEIPW